MATRRQELAGFLGIGAKSVLHENQADKETVISANLHVVVIPGLGGNSPFCDGIAENVKGTETFTKNGVMVHYLQYDSDINRWPKKVKNLCSALSGPVMLVGWSAGSVVAQVVVGEVLKQQEKGQSQVTDLVIMNGVYADETLPERVIMPDEDLAKNRKGKTYEAILKQKTTTLSDVCKKVDVSLFASDTDSPDLKKHAQALEIATGKQSQKLPPEKDRGHVSDPKDVFDGFLKPIIDKRLQVLKATERERRRFIIEVFSR